MAVAEKKDLYLTNEWELKRTQVKAAATHRRLLTHVAFIANEVAFLLMEARNIGVSTSRAIAEVPNAIGVCDSQAVRAKTTVWDYPSRRSPGTQGCTKF